MGWYDENGAGAEIWTRVAGSTVPKDNQLPHPGSSHLSIFFDSAGAGIRTLVGLRQQVLSLSPLAGSGTPAIPKIGKE